MEFCGRIERALHNSAELLAERPFIDGRKDALYRHPIKGYIHYFASQWKNDRPEGYRYLTKSEAKDIYDSFWEDDILRRF